MGFSLGSHDNHVERYTAAVALHKTYMVLTSSDNVTAYNGMNCMVRDLVGWVTENE